MFLKIGHMTDPEEILKLAVKDLPKEEEEFRRRRINSEPINPADLTFTLSAAHEEVKS